MHAKLDDKEDGVYLVRPPPLLVKLGLVSDGVYWKLNKVLYGLRSGPKTWGKERDRMLASRPVKLPDGAEGRCVQCESCSNLWMVVTKDGQVVARVLVYVDDIVISGPREFVKAVIAFAVSLWKCKINGVLVPAGLEAEGMDGIPMVAALTFFGVDFLGVACAVPIKIPSHFGVSSGLDWRLH